MRMKFTNIVNVEKFLKTVDECEGKVELVIDQDTCLNLKSKFNQYTALIKLLSAEKIKQLEVITEKAMDTEKLFDFMMTN